MKYIHIHFFVQINLFLRSSFSCVLLFLFFIYLFYCNTSLVLHKRIYIYIFLFSICLSLNMTVFGNLNKYLLAFYPVLLPSIIALFRLFSEVLFLSPGITICLRNYLVCLSLYIMLFNLLRT